MPALAPCPFCGHTKFHRNTKAKGYFEKHRLQREGKPSSNHLIRCTKCGAKGPLKHSEAEAEQAWNERPSTIQDISAAPAKAMEARRAETGTGSVHDSAVPKAFAQPSAPGEPA